MPEIFDNIHRTLQDGLTTALAGAKGASFCVGYFHLRAWDLVSPYIDSFAGESEETACRILVGMQRAPQEEIRALESLLGRQEQIDGPTMARLRGKIANEFKEQMEFGLPTDHAESTLRRLAAQLRAGKVRLKLFLRYPLHAKLYLVERQDPVTPLIAIVGSSNLTRPGLTGQGELNVDVVDQDAARKLQAWFEECWHDPSAVDLSAELAKMIEQSWACQEMVRPFLVYLKIAYHLCEQARQGERELKLPAVLRGVLLDFQERAVALAIRHLYRHRGVLLGDVVGLGKTLMATAIAKVMQEDASVNTLVICPPKLQPMWEQHLQQYQVPGMTLSLGMAEKELSRLPRYRLVVIDESHNLRNREGKRYRAIRQYIEDNEPFVVLLTATPYNKQYTDLSNQLRLFVDEDKDLHVRPERFFQEWAKAGRHQADFIARFQTSPNSLRAFEQSPHPEDWRDLMRLFLVRRTRRFIMDTYASFDPRRQRHYVTLNGRPHYFPVRQPKRVEFSIDESDPNDQYAKLYREEVVQVIENLSLPRYGMAQYLVADAERLADTAEKRILDNLNRAGRRLIGFCRTNLFKRLESSGYSFLLSLDRHITRNLVTLHALEKGLPVPIGTQDAAMLDAAVNDSDEEYALPDPEAPESALPEATLFATGPRALTMAEYGAHAETIYADYAKRYRNRFDWLPAKFFGPELAEALRKDAGALLGIMQLAGAWNPAQDAKLQALATLLARSAPDKVLVFTQFADTASYLHSQLTRVGLADLDLATSDTGDPVALARRFSPSTNGGLRDGERELRILIATDVLAEGQNLQDAHIVVNYDLPWAIIRLIQRAGRVDRIGQKHDTITVYSFLPAEGVERIIRLRQRLFRRLQENQEVIGTDESFFGEGAANKLRDLYTEKAGVLDDDAADEDIDLASLALRVWNNASPEDQKAAAALPPMVSATRALAADEDAAAQPPGVITYMRFPDGADALVRVDEKGELVSQSLSTIFRAAACAPETPPQPRSPNHNDLVKQCVEFATRTQWGLGGQLGSLRSVRRKLYERLNAYRAHLQNNPHLVATTALEQLDSVIDALYRYPLKEWARDSLSRQMKLGISDQELLELAYGRLQEGTLCEVKKDEEEEPRGPSIICSLGLVSSKLA
ncbi:MAG: phospholipase D-like domain-containing protein [candidate division KSB1 bacterium]|nr:phospholipase D-like domain-containing protein [candidate division KSB1 bacterium]